MSQMMKLCKIHLLLMVTFCVCSLSLFSRPLKILFVVGHFPSASQTFILNQMTRLIGRGHTVLVYAFHYHLNEYMHPDIIKYGVLDCLLYGTLQDLPECDIIFCQFGYLGKKIVESKQLQDWLKGKKVVTCLRGADTTARVKKNNHLYDVLFQKGHLFLPVCEFLKKKLIKLGCNAELIQVHYSAIDCAKFSFKRRNFPQQGPIKFISVCRLVEKKGLQFAIRALAKLVRTYPSIHFTIVGEGPERPHLEKLIKQLHLEKHVTLCGWKTQEEIVALLDASHIFMLPSIKASDGNEEGIANALKEAMAMGLPVITTRHAGNTELIEDGISGYLVPQKDVIALFDKMSYVVAHPEEWATIGVFARQTVEERFEINKNIERLEALFYQLLKE